MRDQRILSMCQRTTYPQILITILRIKLARLVYQFIRCFEFLQCFLLFISFIHVQPILRIFEPILKNASKELLHGSHTRSISISTPSNSGILRFAKKQLTCIGCKALLGYHFFFLFSQCCLEALRFSWLIYFYAFPFFVFASLYFCKEKTHGNYKELTFMHMLTFSIAGLRI